MQVELTVERIVAGGDGIADLDGLKVFVPLAAPQERIRATITTRKRDYAIALIDEIIEPSPLRVEPPCPHYGACGGCQLQHLSYQGQLVVKKLIVNDALQRLGGIFVPAKNLSPGARQWHYRNKTQYPVGWRGKLAIGFYQRGSHRLLDVPTCVLHPEEFDRLRAAAAGAIVHSHETAYDERTHRGNIRHLIVRGNLPGNSLLVTVVTRGPRIAAGLTEALTAQAGVTGVIHSRNAERTNRILGSGSRSIAGDGWLLFDVLDRRLRVSAPSFFQIHSEQAATLCRKVLKHVAPEGGERVLDLYSGVGMLSLVLAGFCAGVTGVEIDHSAVEDARFNAVRNGLDNVRFVEGDVDRVIGSLKRADVVVLDPPRRGCADSTLRQISRLEPHRIVYVSCHPATLARDARVLQGLGYRTVEIEPVDMFPQTFHVETIARLEPAA